MKNNLYNFTYDFTHSNNHYTLTINKNPNNDIPTIYNRGMGIICELKDPKESRRIFIASCSFPEIHISPNKIIIYLDGGTSNTSDDAFEHWDFSMPTKGDINSANKYLKIFQKMCTIDKYANVLIQHKKKYDGSYAACDFGDNHPIFDIDVFGKEE